MAIVKYHDLTGDVAIIRCPFEGCNARIIKLLPSLAATKLQIGNAPEMASKSTYYLQVQDVWDFDNIGVSRAVPELLKEEDVGNLAKVERLLICSECDKGPIGFAGYIEGNETDHKKLQYYLSCESVVYDTQDM
ncbi:CIC11C00000003973 [Sungouiella intermedia]|uniref:CIC11C00000003973 n=1 Tax=Sungouiella intermedia TaxID=45354 RepID=A0A1L0BLV7_9ASCO|nr:CIC11C00000003973 [[Candida] intermedia]